MFKRLFGQGKEARKSDDAASGDVHMPDVDELPNSEEVFDKARRVAAGEDLPPGQTGRHVITGHQHFVCDCGVTWFVGAG